MRIAVDEEELLHACRRGDRDAMHGLLCREAPYLERVLIRIMGPDSELPDVLQETLSAAVRAFPGFRGEASVRTWLTRIAVRSAQRHLRSPHRQRSRARLKLASINGELVEREEGADKQSDARRALDRVYDQLSRLDANKRIAFTLHVIEGRPMREVAALMSASVPATKSRVFFARRALLSRVRSDATLREYFDSENGE